MIDIDEKEDGEIPRWPHPKMLEKMRAARKKRAARLNAERELREAQEAAEKRKEVEREKCKKLLLILIAFIAEANALAAPKF